MKVKEIHVYPIKSTRGVVLERAEVLRQGLRNDRRFMVLDENGSFLTQRQDARMALVEVSFDGDSLRIRADGREVHLPLEAEPKGERRSVPLFDERVDCLDISRSSGAAATQLFTEFLGRSCSLAFMPMSFVRQVEIEYAYEGDKVGFADGFPLLVASTASLADLNTRLDVPVPMNRFRPNIVVEGGEPYAEDHAAEMRIGDLVVRTPKPCARCQIVTIDQATAEQGKDPLKTLAKYRTTDRKVMFAMNAIPNLADDASVEIRVGDAVSYTLATGSR